MHEPKNYQAIMLSSTFTDLKEHRQKAIEAISKLGYMPRVMEHSGAQAASDVIDTSLAMVRESAAYIGVIGLKYGQTPVDSVRNPDQLSITELEFDEATRLGRPIILFIMGDEHPVKKADVESDPNKVNKLDAFRERAKHMRGDSEVQRVYETFESLAQFSSAAAIAVGHLAQHLGLKDEDVEDKVDPTESHTTLPEPPVLAALPRYLGSHSFVGRASELQTLTDWAGPADPNPMLLFEAMGGSGKSMLTWEWLTKHATRARSDWAGHFWYSFYEKGAVMADFCRQALAYMTMKPVGDFAKLRTPELSDRLIGQLEKRPWLLILDGLERVLVAYHRHDAAQLPDEEADTTSDQIGKRDPCAAIRPEDDDLLRRLAAVAPSKLLVSSRLTPLILVNRSGGPVPGVRREILQGLRPADAEIMIRACGVGGQSEEIQAYLQTNCDCHPLVIGALAGLINDYPSDRGNFDRWGSDPHHGGALNLAALNLLQRRNHILLAAIDALGLESRKLLQTLALLHGGADFEALKAFNPHLPPEPEEVKELGDPEKGLFWPTASAEKRARLKADYEIAIIHRQAYLESLAAWSCSPAVRAAPAKLIETIRDLEKRGLLQYDLNGRRYDLHPVVRGISAGYMSTEETLVLGQRVVDYFTTQPHNPWELAEAVEDVADGLQIVRVLLRMGRYEDALGAYRGELANALEYNLGATTEVQALLKPFFPDGWDSDPVKLPADDLSNLLNEAALSLFTTYPDQAWRLLERSLPLDMEESLASQLAVGVRNLSEISLNANKVAQAARLRSLALNIAETLNDDQEIFASRLEHLELSAECGDEKAADLLWEDVERMGRNWSREYYRAGDAEYLRALALFYRGELTEQFLARVTALSKNGRNRRGVARTQQLRGEWCLERKDAAGAVECLTEVVRMAREIGVEDSRSEALLALARFRAGVHFDVRDEAERLTGKEDQRAALVVAELWFELSERGQAVKSALRAHSWAAADGEPYVHRYYLNRASELLVKLDTELPRVPVHDASEDIEFPWEKGIRNFISELKAGALGQERLKNE